MKKSIFTKPKVCKSDSGWYVWFRFNGKLIRKKKGINYIKNIQERELEANALATAYYISLKNGWNPFIPNAINSQSTKNFIDALEFAIKKKKETVSPKTFSAYKGTANFIITSATNLKMDLMNIQDIKRVHIRTIMNEAMKK